MMGVMSTDEARQMARSLDLDLVEVNPKASPPVCKIMDFGKFKYEEKKKQNEARKRQTQIALKEIKLRPKTDDHDVEFKIKHVRRFLEEGNKVQFVVRFRGRENVHPETGKAALDKIMRELAEVARLEKMPVYENRVMTMMVAPK